MKFLRTEIPESIERHIAKMTSDHWRWVGPRTSDGYPQGCIGKGKTFKVLPYLYGLFNRPLGKRKIRPIIGKCQDGHKQCINPAHYELAPKGKKIQMPGVGIGNNPKSYPKPMPGEKNPKAKITSTKVRFIRTLAGKGKIARDIKKIAKVPISETQIRRIALGKNWRHV